MIPYALTAAHRFRRNRIYENLSIEASILWLAAGLIGRLASSRCFTYLSLPTWEGTCKRWGLSWKSSIGLIEWILPNAVNSDSFCSCNHSEKALYWKFWCWWKNVCVDAVPLQPIVVSVSEVPSWLCSCSSGESGENESPQYCLCCAKTRIQKLPRSFILLFSPLKLPLISLFRNCFEVQAHLGLLMDCE